MGKGGGTALLFGTAVGASCPRVRARCGTTFNAWARRTIVSPAERSFATAFAHPTGCSLIVPLTGSTTHLPAGRCSAARTATTTCFRRHTIRQTTYDGHRLATTRTDPQQDRDKRINASQFMRNDHLPIRRSGNHVAISGKMHKITTARIINTTKGTTPQITSRRGISGAIFFMTKMFNPTGG